jgi:hypothetical protein
MSICKSQTNGKVSSAIASKPGKAKCAQTAQTCLSALRTLWPDSVSGVASGRATDELQAKSPKSNRYTSEALPRGSLMRFFTRATREPYQTCGQAWPAGSQTGIEGSGSQPRPVTAIVPSNNGPL